MRCRLAEAEEEVAEEHSGAEFRGKLGRESGIWGNALGTTQGKRKDIVRISLAG